MGGAWCLHIISRRCGSAGLLHACLLASSLLAVAGACCTRSPLWRHHMTYRGRLTPHAVFCWPNSSKTTRHQPLYRDKTVSKRQANAFSVTIAWTSSFRVTFDPTSASRDPHCQASTCSDSCSISRVCILRLQVSKISLAWLCSCGLAEPYCSYPATLILFHLIHKPCEWQTRTTRLFDLTTSSFRGCRVSG